MAQHLTNNLSLYRTGEENLPAIIADWEAFYREQAHESMHELFVSQELRSGAVLPLTSGGQVVGIVLFALHDPWPWPNDMNRLIQIFAIEAASAIAATAFRRQIERSSNFAQQLLKISTAIPTGGDLHQMMERIVQAVGYIYEPCCAWIEVLDAERAQFEQTYTHWHDEAIARELYVQVQDLAWSAVQQEQTVESDLPGPDGRTKYNIAAFPLRIESEIVGVLMVGRPRPGPPQGSERNALQLLAAQAAGAIHSARLYSLAEERSRRLEAAAAQAWEEEARARTLFEAATAVTETTQLPEVLNKIASNAAATIGFERVRIYLADHDKGVLCGATEAGSDRIVVDISDETYHLRSGENMLVDAALSKAPYILYPVSEKEDEGAAEETRYERLVVPLRAGGALVGIVVADNPHSQQSISPQRTRLLRALAGMASVAIDRTQVEKLRELFMSAISHELRTPLASVQAYNELVLDEEVGPLTDEQRDYLSRVDRACQRLRRVIDDLMRWSRLQSGYISINKRPTDIRECITTVVDSLNLQAAKAQVQLQVHLPEESVALLTDAQRAEQIIINLVDNAIKFNHPNGRVDVTLREEAEEVIVDVTDTGPGISPPLQEKIFEAFNRGADETSRGTDGIGLGLALASRIAQHLDGEITLDSQPGAGSTFSLRLPRDSINQQDTDSDEMLG